jgi:hypothetical protein
VRPEIDKIRSITEKELVSIKRVTDATIDLAGGFKVAVMRTRSSSSQLSKYANFCHPIADGKADTRERYVPVDVAIELDRAAGSPAILSVYAGLLGFDIVPASRDTADGEIDSLDALDLLCQAGKVAEEIRAALSDNKIDALERDRIEAELHKIKRCVNSLLRRVGGGA